VQPDSSGKILDLMEALKASLSKTSKPTDATSERMVS
jgi:non-homologous end joining protein Ku